jgi:hypothetical protein
MASSAKSRRGETGRNRGHGTAGRYSSNWLGRTEEAREIYRKGIEVTGSTGDSHTQSELMAALQMLM